MPFDPDKYLAEKTGNALQVAFNPDKYLAEKTGEVPASSSEEQPNKAKSFMSGLIQGPTFGFTDELAAAGDTAMKTATGVIPPSDMLENYRRQRDILRGELNKAQAAHPGANIVGNLIGGLPTASLLTGAPLAANASKADKLAKAMLTGEKVGAVAGLGGSESDLTKGDISGAAGDTAKGAAIGGLAGGALQGLINKFGPKGLAETAQQSALKATGIAKPQMKKLIQQGKVEDMGQRLLDEGVVTPLSLPSGILERSQALKEKSGQEIGDILKQLDVNPAVKSEGFNPSNVSETIKNQLLNPIENEPLLASDKNTVEKILQSVGLRGNNPISFDQANKLKQVLKQAAYNSKGETINDQAARAYGIINKELEEAGGRVAEAASGSEPGLAQKYINAKKNYSTGLEAEKASLGKTAGEAVNQSIGLGDKLASVTGGIVTGGNPLGAGAFALANKAARTFGNSLTANAANKASKLSSMPKQGLQSLAQSLSAQGETGQKLGQMLTQAAERDDVGKNALLFTLMQQPQYRNLLNGNDNVGQ